MSKKTFASSTSYTTSSKPEVKEEVKVETPKEVEKAKARPGSFADLISQ